jgi:hypothetical protein
MTGPPSANFAAKGRHVESKEEVRVLVNLYVFAQRFDDLVNWIWRLEKENTELRKKIKEDP